jgi:hypothetical protein
MTRGSLLLCLVACTSKAPTAATGGSVDAGAAAAIATIDAGAPPAPVEPAPPFDEIAEVLAVDAAACPPSGERVRCLYDQRYRGDAKAAALAYELFAKWQIVAGVEHAYTMDGGYRGMIKIEPAVPVNAERQHLEWIAASLRDFEQFFDELARYARDAGLGPAAAAKLYRWRPITLRFFRSVAARTPSAYAQGWTVAYNLVGSLNKSGDAVRETFFHEMFHLNDYAHATNEQKTRQRAWSEDALRASFDPVSKKCGTTIACLTPYTPTDTIVRGGTYYAFQPGNGDAVVEYAAELATRYFREQRAALRSLTPRPKPFKCGPPENGRAWAAMRDEYFGGIDAVPACP